MAAVSDRLTAEGNVVSHRSLGGGTALVGYKRTRSLIIPTDLFTYLMPCETATPELFDLLIRNASAIGHVDQIGDPTWVKLTILAVVVADHALPEAKEAALDRRPFVEGRGRRGGGRLVWPALVDLAANERYFYTGSLGRLRCAGADWAEERHMVALGPPARGL